MPVCAVRELRAGPDQWMVPAAAVSATYYSTNHVRKYNDLTRIDDRSQHQQRLSTTTFQNA